jgi:hypothetical protein
MVQYMHRKYDAVAHPDTLYTLVNVIATDMPTDKTPRGSYEQV